MFNNHGDRSLNSRILRKLGYGEYEKAIAKDFHHYKRHYVLINMSAHIDSLTLRLCTNLFGETTPHVQFY